MWIAYCGHVLLLLVMSSYNGARKGEMWIAYFGILLVMSFNHKGGLLGQWSRFLSCYCKGGQLGQWSKGLVLCYWHVYKRRGLLYWF